MKGNNDFLFGRGVKSYTVGPSLGSGKEVEPSPRKASEWMSFRLPLPPSTNNLFVSYRKKRFKSPEYKTWIALASWRLRRDKDALPAPVPASISIVILGGNSFNTRRDIDNFAKPILDLLVSQGVIKNDNVKHVSKLQITFDKADGEESSCLVTIEKA